MKNHNIKIDSSVVVYSPTSSPLVLELVLKQTKAAQNFRANHRYRNEAQLSDEAVTIPLVLN
jgi:hypothetical protein